MLSSPTLSSVSPTPKAFVSNPPHPSSYSPIKRGIDIAGSLVGLLILALVFIPIAIAIKTDSKGPIFFVQKRYGLRGKPFLMYKFRSMVRDADLLKSQIKNEAKGLLFKNKRDPRITRVGNFLRRTSLDELPQFWNVLLGEMSLVGTRPPTEDEVMHYNDHHWERLNVRPGITGEWQVSGRSEITDFEQIVNLDLRYQTNWSPLYDLQIIVKTLQCIVDRKGAC